VRTKVCVCVCVPGCARWAGYSRRAPRRATSSSAARRPLRWRRCRRSWARPRSPPSSRSRPPRTAAPRRTLRRSRRARRRGAGPAARPLMKCTVCIKCAGACAAHAECMCELGVRSRVGLGREGSEGRGSAARAHRAGVRPGGAALAGGLVPGGGGARRRAGAAQPQGAPRPAGHGLLCRRLRTSGARPSLPPGPPSGARWHRGGRQGQLRCCCAPRRRAVATLPPHECPVPAAP